MLAAAAVIVALAGCAPLDPTGRATVVSQSTPELPEYVSYAAGTELADVSAIGLTSDFPANPDWLTLTGGGTDVTIEMTDAGCSLLMRRGSSDDLGRAFTGEDATDTVATLAAHVGTAPQSTLPLLWSGNDGAISVDALIFVVLNDEGEQVVALARAFGSLDTFLYAELTCGPGISTEAVFAEKVVPHLAVKLS